MMRKYQVRFGGGRLEKGSQGHLARRLPYWPAIDVIPTCIGPS